MGLSLGADTCGDFRRFHGEPVDPRARVPEPLLMSYPYGTHGWAWPHRS